MRAQRDNSIYIAHIRDAIEMISAYVSVHDFEQFLASEWDQAAIVRYFEIIGEATTRLDTEFKK